MSDEFVLSASSVTTFLRCGRQWFFAYVAGIKAPPSLKAVRGIAVHKAVETNMRQKLSSGIDLPVQDVLDAYDTSWTQETQNGWRAEDGLVPGQIKDGGVELVKVYQRDVAPGIQPAIVEEPISFRINGQIYTGQIDLGQYVPTSLWGPPEHRLEVRDTKTTARSPDPSQYLLNMTGYAMGSRVARGEVEADIVFDYLVATQKPYYKEVRMGGPITDAQIRAFSETVGSVSDAIQKGSFVANGLITGACSWCGFRPMCPAYLRQNPNA